MPEAWSDPNGTRVNMDLEGLAVSVLACPGATALPDQAACAWTVED
jgi:hypothetical protein